MRISTPRLLSASLLGVLLGFVLSPSVAAQTNFGSVNFGSSATSTVTVTIPNGGTVNTISVVTQGAPNLDFFDAGGGSCVAGVTVSSCTVNVTFAPKYAGIRNGAVVLSDTNGVIATAYLLGTGVGPQAAIFVSANFVPEAPSVTTVPASLFGVPSGVVVDGSGNVYIGDSGSTTIASEPPRVLKESLSAGKYTQSVIASGLNNPTYLATDGAGNIYIFDGYLYKETLSNGGYSQSKIDPGISGISSVAVDGSGNIYVTDGQRISVGILQSNGSFAYSELPLPVSTSDSYPFRIYGFYDGIPGDVVGDLAVDENGNVFFTTYLTEDDQATEAIPTGYLDIFEEKLSGGVYSLVELGPFYGSAVKRQNVYPVFGVAVDAAEDIYMWEPNYLIASGAPGPGLSEYMLSGGHLAPPAIADFLIGENIIPYSLAFDSNGSIYISDALEVPVNGTTSVAGVYEVDLKNPATINFASTPEGTTNGIPAVVQIINNGTFTLTFSEVSYPADFPFAVGETYVGASGICNVGTSLAAQESCWLVIAFNPTTPLGANSSAELTENISITTNAIPATQSITVSGMETAPLAATPSFSVASGLYSSIQSVTLSDSTTGATIFYTTDGKTTPTSASIKYTGAITVSSNETIQAIAAVPGYANSFVASATYTFQPGFAIAGAPITVTAGATSGNTFAITLTPIGGFTGNVALTAAITSGPSGGIQPTMSFGSTTPTSITNAGAVTSTLTITTTASSATQCSSENRMRQGIPWYSSGGAVLACVLLFGIPARRRSWLKMLGMSLLLVALAGGAIACGGGGGGTNCTPTTTSGTTPGTYTITVTGTSNLSTSTGTVSLTVQ